MKGKRIGLLVVSIALMGLLLSPAGVRGAVSVGATVAADSAYLNWDDQATIRWNTTVSSGGWGYFNGTVYINLTAPSMNRFYYSSAVVLDDTTLNDWYNFSFDPNEAGRWTITAEIGGADALENITVPNAENAFTVESQGSWMSRTIQDFTAVMWLILIISALFVVLILVFNRVNQKGRDT